MLKSETGIVPIGVGGVGGSGTRLIADLLNHMGAFMGPYVQPSNDNLSWPPFRKLLADIDPLDESTRRKIAFKDIARFEAEMLGLYTSGKTNHHTWFWKVPTTFFWLEYLAEYFEGMKYIHVIRHGVDMAFTKNIRQFVNWAHFVGIEVSTPVEIAQLLEYWIKANDLAVSKARDLLGERFLLLSFDDVCTRPQQTLEEMMEFVGTPASEVDIDTLLGLINKPSSMGRYQQHDYRTIFTGDMLDAVRSYGFDVVE